MAASSAGQRIQFLSIAAQWALGPQGETSTILAIVPVSPLMQECLLLLQVPAHKFNVFETAILNVEDGLPGEKESG
jgi:hypothetical protein